MNVLIDARVLQHDKLSGVGMYTKHIIKALNNHTKSKLTLVTTGVRPKNSLQNYTCKVVHKRIPNKLLNASITLLQRPIFGSHIKKPFDIVFFPHVHFSIIPKNTPSVLMIHDTTFLHHKECYSLKRKLWHKAINIKKQIKQVTHIVCPSEQTKKDLIKFFNVKKDKITVIPHGVTYQKSDKKVNKQKYILFIGTIEPRKNIEALVRAFTHSDLKNNGYKCIIVGAKGWKTKNLKKWINHKDVEYRGFVSEKEKVTLIQEAATVVYPSFYEGFGFPILEAMSLGTPVITAANSSIVEVAQNAAYYVNPYKITDLIDAFNTLLVDQKMFDNLATAGIKQAQKFTWQKSALALDTVFTKIK